MTDLRDAVMSAAFQDELQKIATARGLKIDASDIERFLEMQKEAGFLGDMSAAAGKKGRAALLGLSLMGGVGAPMAAKLAPDAPVVHQVMKRVPGTAANEAAAASAKKVKMQKAVDREMAIQKSYEDRGASPSEAAAQRTAAQAAIAARY